MWHYGWKAKKSTVGKTVLHHPLLENHVEKGEQIVFYLYGHLSSSLFIEGLEDSTLRKKLYSSCIGIDWLFALVYILKFNRKTEFF